MKGPSFSSNQLPFFYGWVVIAVTTLAMFATGPGQTFTVAVFLEPVRADLGLSRTAISAAYSTASLMAASALMLVGRGVDRFGGQKALITFGLAFGIGCLGIAFAWDLTSLTFGFAALRMLGPGALALSASVLAVQWFVRYRGRAMSITVLGLAASSALVPIIAQHLITEVGWRSAWQLLGLFVWMAVIPPAALLARDRPEHIGLKPDGGIKKTAVSASSQRSEDNDWTTSQAARTKAFWLLLLVVAVPSMVSTGMIFHQVSFMVEEGLGSLVAFVFLAYGATNILSIPISGLLLDRGEPRRVLFGVLVLLLLATSFLLVVPIAPFAAIGYGLVLGVAVGGSSTASGVVWVHYYGRRYVGSIRGIEGMVKMLAAALGPLPLAVARDQFGSYAPGLVVFAVLTVLATVAVASASAPKRV